MRILTWNLQHGGGKRIDRFGDDRIRYTIHLDARKELLKRLVWITPAALPAGQRFSEPAGRGPAEA